MCIYLSNSVFAGFTISPIDLLTPGSESLALHVKSPRLNLVLCCVYRPPNSAAQNDQITFESLSHLTSTFSNVIIMGDFNMPDLRWPSFLDSPHISESSQILSDFLINSHVTQLVTEPTRFRLYQQPSILDLIMTSDRNLLGDLEYLPPLGKSDHVVLKSSIQYTIHTPAHKECTHRNFTNYTALNEDILNINWDTTLNLNEVNSNWEVFTQTLEHLIRKNTTTRTVTTIPSKPWITEELLAMIRKKRALWQRYRRSGRVDDFIHHRQFSNRLGSDLSRARTEFEASIANSNDPKRFYKYIRSNLESVVTIPQLKRSDGTVSNDYKEVATIFSDSFFESYTQEPAGVIPEVLGIPRVQGSLSNVIFSEQFLEEKIQNLKNSVSPGIDNISASLLKACSTSLCKPLRILMEMSFASGDIPIQWRTAIVKPIFKKGDKFEASNYRPISLTPIAVKLMESIIVDGMRPFLAENEIIPVEQHGFTPGRSVESNLLCCVADWSKMLDNCECVDIVYLDFSKAFDKVPKIRLLHKLEHFGIRGPLLAWIESFLSNRVFKVKVGSAFSESRNVLSGVPQGSVLGPLLFLLYTSDIRHHISSFCSFYADDTKIYSNPLTCHQVIQQDLYNIQEWSDIWLLPLNTTKCVVLHLGKSNPRLPYSMNNTTLSTVNSHDDLGVLITMNLTWSDHIARQVKKANSRVYLILRVFENADHNTLSKLFKLYVRPILEFANSVWCPSLVRDVNLLENVQRRYTRLAFGHDRPPYEARLHLLNLPLLSTRRIRGDLIITYKTLHNNTSPIRHLYKLNNDERLRGHPLKLLRDPFRSVVRQNFLTLRVFYRWNSLPHEIVCAPSLNSFKARLDNMVL